MPENEPRTASRRSRAFAIVQTEYGELFDTPTARAAEQAMADWSAMSPAERTYHQSRLQFAQLRALDELSGQLRALGRVMVDGFEVVAQQLDALAGEPEQGDGDGDGDFEEEEDAPADDEGDDETPDEDDQDEADEGEPEPDVIDGEIVTDPDGTDDEDEAPAAPPRRRFPRLEAGDEE